MWRVGERAVIAVAWRWKTVYFIQEFKWNRREVFSNTILEFIASMGYIDCKNASISSLFLYSYHLPYNFAVPLTLTPGMCMWLVLAIGVLVCLVQVQDWNCSYGWSWVAFVALHCYENIHGLALRRMRASGAEPSCFGCAGWGHTRPANSLEESDSATRKPTSVMYKPRWN